jgi:ABC-type lipoprotein release transport system permease subunit
MLLSIAWRNLWRNPRRTLSAVAAVGGGVAMMVIVTAMLNGMSDRMLEAATGSLIGHVQIHREGFRESRTATLALADADRVLDAVRAAPGVEDAAGRIYGFGHVSIVRGDDGEVRAGGGEEVAAPVVALLGVEPGHERAVTDIAGHVVEGRWLGGDADVVLGAGLARRTGARVGDAVLPTTSDLGGAMRGPWAAGEEVPRVVGIARTGMEEMDGQVVLMTRSYLGRLTGMEGQVHEVAIRAESAADLPPVVDSIRAAVRRARAGAERLDRIPATAPLPVVAGDSIPARGDRADGGPDAAEEEPTTVRLLGVEPGPEEPVEGEPAGTGLRAGRFLARSEDIVLSAAMADALAVSPGDRVAVAVPVACGEGVPEAECPPSSESFVVAGVLAPEGDLLDGRFAFVTSAVLRGNIAALAPSVVVGLEGGEARRAAALARGAAAGAAGADEVLPWYGVAPEIQTMLVVFGAAPVFMVLIIFLAVSIGIVNTLLMATYERIKELGLMKALGMRPSGIVALVLAESALLAVVGIALGLSAGMAVIGYWSISGLDVSVFMGEQQGFSIAGVTFDPVLWPRVAAPDLVKTLVPVAILTTVAGLSPALLAARIEVTAALRHE